MSEARARMAYTGTFEPGTMDARVLGPALISLAAVCESANECLNGNRAKATVRIRADFKTGSFDFVYQVVQTLSDHARRLVGLDPAIVGPKEILAFLGFISTTASAGAITALRLIRAWHDTEPDLELEADNTGKTTIKLHGKSYRVRKEVVRLARYPPLRTALGGLAKPLSEPDVDALEIRQPRRGTKKVIDVITKEDVPILSAPVPELPPPAIAPVEQQFSGKRTAILKIVRAGLVGDVTWTFSEGDGSGQVSMPIEDRDFLEARDKGQFAFRSGDFLEVEIEWQTTISGAHHTTKQRIVRVLRHIERPIQQSLPLPSKDSDV